MSPFDHAQALALTLANNHASFESFGWHSRPDDSEDWGIVYTSTRDSSLVAVSNEAAIETLLAPLYFAQDPSAPDGERTDIVRESHGHWACGHVDGYAIRVYVPRASDVSALASDVPRELTPAFLAWADIQARLEDYPLLDESDHSEREHNATLENIASAGARFVRGSALAPDAPRDATEAPSGWEGSVFSWLWDNDQSELESCDGQGGYPSDAALKAAIKALGWLEPEYDDDVTAKSEAS